MKRIALIIGSPSHSKTPEAGQYLAGVKTDIANIIGFLSSSVGGSWTESEIKRVSENPKYSEIKPVLKECENADFAFIYFSGHGYTNVKENPSIVLNSQESVDVIIDLANRAKHQVTIIDACRSYPEFIGFDGEIFLESVRFPNDNPKLTKDLLAKYISNLPNTRVLLCATSKGKTSMDYGVKYGGLFSTNLLSVVKDKLKSDKKAVFKIADVFNIAKIKTSVMLSMFCHIERSEISHFQKYRFFTSFRMTLNLTLVKFNLNKYLKYIIQIQIPDTYLLQLIHIIHLKII